MNMASAVEYTKEQLNYYRICYVMTDILADGLQSIFKQEWDNRYEDTKGEWKDELKNGLDFWNGESPDNKRKHAHLLTIMVNGNRGEWNCTMLFYAILSSDCIHSLSPAIQSNVEDLQKFRKEEFTNMPREHLSDAEFENAISRVDVAFQALCLPTDKIQAIKNQTNFATEELRDVLKKVANLKQNKNEVDEAAVYSDLGSVHNHLSDLEKAKECYDLALAIRLEKLGPEHVDVATTYNKLGNVHLHLGDLFLAKEYFDRALAIGL